jgi:hypothetical protein
MGKLIMVAPSNGQNYDSFIYAQYFNTSIPGDIAADDTTMAAIAAINALPDRVTLANEALVIAARAAYNKIGSAEQQALVTEYYQKLLNAENLIKAYKNTDTEDAPVTDEAPVIIDESTKKTVTVLQS